jgi:hypothetical protein
MSSPAIIKTALERNLKAIAARPSIAQGTAVTKVTLHPGSRAKSRTGPGASTSG